MAGVMVSKVIVCRVVRDSPTQEAAVSSATIGSQIQSWRAESVKGPLVSREWRELQPGWGRNTH